MNIKHLILATCSCLLMLACSHIGEDERLVYVKPAQVNRAVLVEDFTGQRCVNCPLATDEIHKLQEQYGDTAVIAVGIHSGPLGFYSNARYVGLSTATGDEYYSHWGLEFQPVGLINRSAPMEYTSWSTRIYDELQKPAPLSLSMSAQLQGSELSIEAEAMGTDGTTKGKLQVWVVEDSIEAFQYMPDGSRDYEYLHQHVFRCAVNGTWGDDITVAEGERVQRSFVQPLDEAWQPARLSVVAFVYNDGGVQQVTKKKITLPNNP